MQQILCVLFFVFNIYLTLVVQAQNLPSKSLPKNLIITLNYWQQINGFFGYNEKLPNECKIKSTINQGVFICPAWVKILINKKQLLSWQQQQNKNGFINLYLPEIGILHEKAKIAKIKKVASQVSTNKNQHLVTALYMRYAHILKYKIKNTNTGKIDEITTTPEHKFYETTYNKFMAISKLGPYNTLINFQNHHLKIICTNNRQNNCGTAPLNSLQKVYNMEVEKAHNYFVGNIKALVHNGCYDHYYRCKVCKENHATPNLFPDECKTTPNKKHILNRVYQCELCGSHTLNKKTASTHKILHENRDGKYNCTMCSTTFKQYKTLRLHQVLHRRNGNTIFCGACDKRILLKEMLNGQHSHKLYSQLEYVQKLCFTGARSPINFLTGMDTGKLSDFSTLDIPVLSSYEN